MQRNRAIAITTTNISSIDIGGYFFKSNKYR